MNHSYFVEFTDGKTYTVEAVSVSDALEYALNDGAVKGIRQMVDFCLYNNGQIEFA